MRDVEAKAANARHNGAQEQRIIEIPPPTAEMTATAFIECLHHELYNSESLFPVYKFRARAIIFSYLHHM